jgi:hypothetical protein
MGEIAQVEEHDGHGFLNAAETSSCTSALLGRSWSA